MTTALADFLCETVQGFRNLVSGSRPQRTGRYDKNTPRKRFGAAAQLAEYTPSMNESLGSVPLHPISGVVGHIYIPGGSVDKDEKFKAILSYVTHETPCESLGSGWGCIGQTLGKYQMDSKGCETTLLIKGLVARSNEPSLIPRNHKGKGGIPQGGLRLPQCGTHAHMEK